MTIRKPISNVPYSTARICLMQGAENMLENFAKALLGEIRGATS
jgi:hypothetical protein